jgi:hypothetical protein
MPVAFANELRGTAGEPKNNLLEISVFALPYLKTIPEKALNLSAGRFCVRKFSTSF